MSYILDALKKSERERPPGPVPDLFTQHGPQPLRPRRPVRAIAAVILLVVLAIALGAWIGKERGEERAARPPEADSAKSGLAPPVAQEPPPADVAPAPAVPVRAAATAGARSGASAERLPATAPRSRGVTPSLGFQAGTPPVAPAVSPPAVPAVAIAPSPVAVPQPPLVPPPPPSPPMSTAPAAPAPAAPAPVEPALAAPSSMTPAPPTIPAAGAASPAPVQTQAPAGEPTPPGIPPAAAVPVPEPAVVLVEEPPADGRVLDLAELPATIRAQLPKLLVSGHVWSEEPALRLLSVDDRLLREGGEAAAGVRLQEITASGAVFVYAGWRFRIAGARP